MIAPIFTKPDLDELLRHGCSDPHCQDHDHALEELYLHSRCHPDAGTWVAYQGEGVLSVECAECREPICLIKL